MTLTKKKPTKHYVDNQRFLKEILEYKERVALAKAENKEKPRIPEYIGGCLLLMAQKLSTKPRFMNYSFKEEMISDAIENCVLYFDNFNPNIGVNPFAYFTQIIYYAFHRRINKEEKIRYTTYKSFSETILETGMSSLLVDGDNQNLTTPAMYDNINEAIRKFEAREAEKKTKRKTKKEGLEKFIEGEDNEGEV